MNTKQLCREINTAVSDSTILKYRMLIGRCGYIDTDIELDSEHHTSVAELSKEFSDHVARWHTLDWVESRFMYPSWALDAPAVLENGILATRDEANSSLAFLQLPDRFLASQQDSHQSRSWTFGKMDPVPQWFTLDATSDVVAYLIVR